MKRIIFTLLFFIYFSSIAQEKNNLNTWSVGVGLTNTLVHGDLSSVNNLDKNVLNLGFYAQIDKMITPIFGVQLKGQVAQLNGFSQELSSGYPIDFTNYNNGDLYFEGSSFGGELNLVINLNAIAKNPYSTKKRKFNFTTYLGLGYHSYNSELFSYSKLNGVDFSYTPTDNLEKSAVYVTTGIGVRYYLNKRLDLEFRQNLNFNSADDLDAAITKKQRIESFFVTQLGLVVKLYGKDQENIIWDEELNAITEKSNTDVDTDKDGVVDRFDVEANTPKGSLVYANGVAVDSDKDGVIDFYDKCPLVFGVKDQKGCPIDKELDTDGDSVFDYLDKEKETPKGAKVDKEGRALDSDNDGIIDLLDECPLIKGNVSNHGCPPDRDKDGIYDINDLCPDIPGNAQNKGCPNPMSEEDNMELVKLAKNIYFESGKYFLRDSSKRQLEKVFDIMENNTELKFIIEGHTDSGGKHDYNMKLSQNRVNSVKTYLVRLGINPERLKPIGYGFTRPNHTNASSKGRQLNRRVEITVDSSSINNIISSKTYVVQQDDTLSSIAKKYGVSVEKLKLWNSIIGTKIVYGERLIIKK